MLNKRKASGKYKGFSFEIRFLNASIYYCGNEMATIKFHENFDRTKKEEIVDLIMFILSETCSQGADVPELTASELLSGSNSYDLYREDGWEDMNVEFDEDAVGRSGMELDMDAADYF